MEYIESISGAEEIGITLVRAPEEGIAAALIGIGRPGLRVEAVFAMTVSAEAARISVVEGKRARRVTASEPLLALVRESRARSARSVAGPWWRMSMRIDEFALVETEYDYGEEPFPGDQLFRPEAYRDDIAAYPRPRLPVWLAAYIGHADRQSRGRRSAALAARADRLHGVRQRLLGEGFPELPRLWARWAALAAAHVAVGSEDGPRIVPDTGWYEAARNASSGSSLYVLPGGRAVLSGGVWNAPPLNAAYNGGIELPNLYAGAPDWVTNAALNPRAAVGLLSFCYWWDGERWYRGESPSVRQCGAALPPIWSAGSVLETIVRLLSAQPSLAQRAGVARLMSAVERGAVGAASLVAAFGSDADIDGAYRQFASAGLVPAEVAGSAEVPVDGNGSRRNGPLG
ncbi:hypothetical protein D5S18_23195 [Nocardia panacis]|uniref:Uncharacterized protein n=1 Tax=Nocardia panacis TaxID=2340916 RepID=A0A3A4KQF7_9NOCA|nr:hypothetical protein [Nocardia panacis]RJO72087.1 hypothetical protein D5S18_23195 [Nocardia panacis]